MTDMKNITRGPEGWTVRIVRDGQQHSSYFRFSDGGFESRFQEPYVVAIN